MDSLKQFSLFEGVDEQLIERFDKQCTWRNYAPGELIIDHHDSTNDVRFIASGEVRVVVRMGDGREVIFNDHQAGTYFGEVASIDGKPRSANVTALTKTRLCILPAPALKMLVYEAPQVGWQIMEKLVELVRNLSTRLAEFTFLQAKHRICAELLRTSRPRQGFDDQRIVSPPPIQKDIADRVSSRREVVSREMKVLERDGILEKSRGGLIIVNVEELRRRASEGWTQNE